MGVALSPSAACTISYQYLPLRAFCERLGLGWRSRELSRRLIDFSRLFSFERLRARRSSWSELEEADELRLERRRFL